MPTDEQIRHVELISEFLQRKRVQVCRECPYDDNMDRHECKNLCMGFIGLQFYEEYLRECCVRIMCPCKQFGELGAVDRTWKAIVDFDLKRHRWWKE